MKFKGFTLSEILITLGIIGVVAAMTIPSVLYKYQSSEYSSRIKKVYGLVSAAFDEAWREAGGDVTATKLPIDTVRRAIQSTLKVRSFGFGQWYPWYTSSGASWDYSVVRYVNSGYILPDGSRFSIYGPNCNTGKFCGYIVDIDSNGEKGPNIIGKDIFVFIVSEAEPTLKPLHSAIDSSYNGASCSTCTGYSCLDCTTLLMRNGFEVNW